MHDSALVLFSGGQDSTTCLADALSRFARVETLGFNYGQRHLAEMRQRGVVRAALAARFPAWAGRLGDDHVIDLQVLGQISDTALTRDTAIALGASGLPNTFVPGRNLIFLTFAGALAYRRGLQVIVTGVCETDYSGYPDCRDDTMKAMQLALSLGMDRRLVVDTPLMWLDKAATWARAQALGDAADPAGGGAALIDILVEHSHTCYEDVRDRRHDWGYGCGRCPACTLRAAGWQRWRAAAQAQA